eukprot:scaffold715_cov112-Isochrysis_galbana.AAC.1
MGRLCPRLLRSPHRGPRDRIQKGATARQEEGVNSQGVRRGDGRRGGGSPGGVRSSAGDGESLGTRRVDFRCAAREE